MVYARTTVSRWRARILISYIRNLSIKAQLTILCLIILVPLLVFQGMEIRAKYRTLYDHEVQANLEIARATRAMFVFLCLTSNLLRVEAALVVGSSQKELINEEISRAFKDFEDQSGIVSNLDWYRPQGRVLASSLPNAIGVDVSERPHVIAIMKGQDWFISDLFVGKAEWETLLQCTQSRSRQHKPSEGNTDRRHR